MVARSTHSSAASESRGKSGEAQASLQRHRFAALDIARGLAIVGMVAYHFVWDLEFLALAPPGTATESGFQWLAYGVAASFLAIAGFSLALMTRHRLRLLSFGQRLLRIGACALLITAATYLVTPDSYVFFGILHAIAVGSVICLFLVRTPWPVIASLGLVVLVVPQYYTSTFFDQPALLWLGFQTYQPFTNDHVPLFPWLGMMLLGLAAGRWTVSRPQALETLAGPEARGPTGRLLAGMGRHSLLIYMVHQPLLIGLLMGYAWLVQTDADAPGAQAPATLEDGGRVVVPLPEMETPSVDLPETSTLDTAEFVHSCVVNCEEAGGGEPCRSYCLCVADGLQETPLWDTPGLDDATLAEDPAFWEIVEQCQVPENAD